MRRLGAIAAILAMLFAGGALARSRVATGTPAVMQSLLACRAISDSAARLACYDRSTGALVEQIQKKDLVMIDQERAAQAKREVFGFSVPSFAGLLGGGPLNQIESTVAGAGENGEGGWTVKLADGSVWSQTDDSPLALPPRSGDKVVVSRGTLGSYFMRLGHQPGVKVKRIA